MKRIVIILMLFNITSINGYSQGCCSGGSGSPMVGGVSMGVLQQGQFDFGESFQYFSSDKFYAGSLDSSSALVKDIKTSYLYSRLGYGITSKLTLYLEAGYFFHKTETGFDTDRPDYIKKSSGLSDIIIFPRYNVYDITNSKAHTELTLGLGLKIPIGNYHDSTTVYIDPTNGQNSKTVSPPTVQTTTGSNDFIFYGFALREFKKIKLKVFANVTYINKGYNSMGEKFGDYASIGLFAGKTYFKKLGVTCQLKYEWVDKMQLNPNIDLNALKISIDPNSSGSKKLSFVPQLSYSYKSITLFGLYDMPVYQYLNGVQIGSKYLVTVGFTYRFKPTKFLWKVKEN